MDFFKRKDLIVIILLIGLGFLTAGVYLQAINAYKIAFNSIARLAGMQSEESPLVDLSVRKVLAWAGVPVYNEAQRLTFNSSNEVSYRAKASAQEITAFYSSLLMDRGWEEVENAGQQLTFFRGDDELSIALAENEFSGKTKITYAFEPTSAVLGIKLAQEGTPPPPSGDGGSYTPPPSGSGSYTPPSGGTYTPPSEGSSPQPTPPPPAPTGQCTPSGGDCCNGSPSDPDCGGTSTNPPSSGGGCTPPPSGCGMNSYWDQARCMCSGGEYKPQTNEMGGCGGGTIKCYSAGSPNGWCQMAPCPAQNQSPEQQPYQNNQQNQYQQPYQQQPYQTQQPMMQPNQYQDKANQQNQFSPQATCRVNGVEMPGPCSNYNQQGQKMDQGQMGQGDQMNQNGQMGPSEEDMKKMDERRFQDMKRGLSQFSKGTSQMKKSVERARKTLAKCGVGIPEELDNALKATDGLIKNIQDATTADELENIISDVEDVGMTMQEWGPRMGDLSRLCQMMRQGDRDMKSLEREVKKMESRVKANKKLDLTEALNQFKANVASIKGVFLNVVTLAKTDPASALEKLEDEFYGTMDDVQNSRMVIDTALNVSQGLRNASSEIKKIESQIKSLKKKKIDTSAAEDLLATMKEQIAELQKLIKGKFDAEELIVMVEDAYQTRSDLQSILEELSGSSVYVPNIKADTKMNINVDLPDAFMKQPMDSGEEMMGPSASGGGMGGGQGMTGQGF